MNLVQFSVKKNNSQTTDRGGLASFGQLLVLTPSSV